MFRFNYLILSLAFVSAVSFAIALNVSASHYGNAGNTIDGWLWGGSTNDSEQGCDGSANADCGALGWGSATRNNGGLQAGEHEYGLFIPPPTCSGSACNVSGSVWFANVGWVNFRPGGPYPNMGCDPICPNHGAMRSGNDLIGWARVDSIAEAGNNSGGFGGWIKMSGISGNGSSYGASISPEGVLGGKAWSDEFGWVYFDVNFGGGGSCDVDSICDAGEDQNTCPSDCHSSCSPVSPYTCVVGNGPPPGPNCNSDAECQGRIRPSCVGNQCRPVFDGAGDCTVDDDCPGGGNLIVTCSGSPDPTFLSRGGVVTWDADVSGANGNITYTWLFDPPPVSIDYQGGREIAEATYNATGIKEATVSARDRDGNTGSAECSVNVRWSQL